MLISTLERVWNSQVDIKILPVDVSQADGLPQNWHSGHMNGMVMFAETEATQEPNSMNSHFKANLAASVSGGLTC